MWGTECGMRVASLGDNSIGSHSCNSRYHLTSVCMGLPDSIIKTIKECGEMDINLCCIFCRLDGGSGSNAPQSGSIVDGSTGLDGGVSEQAVKQLLKTVKSL